MTKKEMKDRERIKALMKEYKKSPEFKEKRKRAFLEGCQKIAKMYSEILKEEET